MSGGQDIDRILDRIRKLLALGESSNEHEAAIAVARAQELLARYHLSIEDLHAAEYRANIIEEPIVFEGRSQIDWVYRLFKAVQEAFDCRSLVVYRSGTQPKEPWRKPRRYEMLVLVGTEANIKVARLTFDYLCDTVERLTKNHEQETCDQYGYWEFDDEYLDSFKNGLAFTIGFRLRLKVAENREKAEQAAVSASGTGLVLHQENALDEYMKKYSEGDYERRSRERSESEIGFRFGLEAGHDVGLDTQIHGGEARRLLPGK